MNPVLAEWEFDEETLNRIGRIIDQLRSFEEVLNVEVVEVENFFKAMQANKLPMHSKRKRDDGWIQCKAVLICSSIAHPITMPLCKIDALLRHVVNGTPLPEFKAGQPASPSTPQ